MYRTGIQFLPPILQSSPRRNFSRIHVRKRTESSFVLSFARNFVSFFPNQTVLMARELSLNGYGIADLVCLVPCSGESNLLDGNLFAFEMKVNDWRKAISQAFRYRYFANKSIVVLPQDHIKRAEVYLKTFKALGIGLWAYDKECAQVRQLYTPRWRQALSRSARTKALNILRVRVKPQPAS